MKNLYFKIDILSVSLSLLLFFSIIRGIGEFLGNMEIYYAFRWTTMVVSLLLVWLIARKNYNLREAIVLVFTGLCSVVATICSGQGTMLRAFLLIAAAKDVKLQKIFKVVAWTAGLTFLLIVGLFLLGFIHDGALRRGFSALGFGHPNGVGQLLMTIIFAGYLLIDRVRWYHYFLLVMSTLGVWILTDSRAACVGLILQIMGAVLVEREFFKSYRKFFYSLAGLVFPLLLIGTYCVSTVFVDTDFVQMLDEVLSWRISLSNWAFENIGISWFGSDINYKETGELLLCYGNRFHYLVVDNAYCELLVRFGVVMTAFAVFVYEGIVCKAYKNIDDKILVVLVVTAIYMLMEQMPLDLTRGFVFLYLLAKTNVTLRNCDIVSKGGQTVTGRKAQGAGRKVNAALMKE